MKEITPKGVVVVTVVVTAEKKEIVM